MLLSPVSIQLDNTLGVHSELLKCHWKWSTFRHRVNKVRGLALHSNVYPSRLKRRLTPFSPLPSRSHQLHFVPHQKQRTCTTVHLILLQPNIHHRLQLPSQTLFWSSQSVKINLFLWDQLYSSFNFDSEYCTVKKNPARTEKVEAFCDAFPACGHFYANVWICRHQRRFHWRPVRTLTFRPYDLTLQSLDVRAGLPMKRPWHQEVLPSILKFTETYLKSFSLGFIFSSVLWLAIGKIWISMLTRTVQVRL